MTTYTQIPDLKLLKTWFFVEDLQFYQSQLSKDLQFNKKTEAILKIRKKATFLFKVISKSIISRFNNRLLIDILKYRSHRWDFPTIWKTRLLIKTHIEMLS